MAWRRAKAQAVKDSNGVCQLCGEQLDPTARKNTPWATEIDHIVPLADGGAPYARENLRALHQWCHARRGKGKPPPRIVPADPVAWVPPDPWVNCPTCPNSCSYPRPASRCW